MLEKLIIFDISYFLLCAGAWRRAGGSRSDGSGGVMLHTQKTKKYKCATEPATRQTYVTKVAGKNVRRTGKKKKKNEEKPLSITAHWQENNFTPSAEKSPALTPRRKVLCRSTGQSHLKKQPFKPHFSMKLLQV